jgi:Segregation and condensation complex subunit ScpB
MAIGYFQPITRGELAQFLGREVSRDAIAGLRGEGFTAAGPRSRTPGAPYAYVTTPAFLAQFGFESLRDLPDMEKLEDAGLLGTASRDQPGRAGLALRSATGEAAPDRTSLLAEAYLALRPKRTSPRRMRPSRFPRGQNALRSARPGSGRGRSSRRS